MVKNSFNSLASFDALSAGKCFGERNKWNLVRAMSGLCGGWGHRQKIRGRNRVLRLVWRVRPSVAAQMYGPAHLSLFWGSGSYCNTNLESYNSSTSCLCAKYKRNMSREIPRGVIWSEQHINKKNARDTLKLIRPPQNFIRKLENTRSSHLSPTHI